MSDRLTINPGLRYEQEKLAGTIINDFTLKNNWAPRIGATYDLDGRCRRRRCTAAYGRYYARDSQRPRGARAVGRRRHQPRRLLRRRADAAHSERRAGGRRDASTS